MLKDWPLLQSSLFLFLLSFQGLKKKKTTLSSLYTCFMKINYFIVEIFMWILFSLATDWKLTVFIVSIFVFLLLRHNKRTSVLNKLAFSSINPLILVKIGSSPWYDD